MQYPIERQELHESIVSNVIAEINASWGERKTLVFIAAPSATGKSAMIDMLKREQALPNKNYVHISSKTYEPLPEYQALLPARHPELTPELYEEHLDIRQKILTASFSRNLSVLVEIHLTEQEILSAVEIANQAKRQEYLVVFMGITIQPEKFFSNAAKVLASGEGMDMRQSLQEHCRFFSLWSAISDMHYKLLIDFNRELAIGGRPFLVAKEDERGLLVLNQLAWMLARKTEFINIDAQSAEEAYPADIDEKLHAAPLASPIRLREVAFDESPFIIQSLVRFFSLGGAIANTDETVGSSVHSSAPSL